MDLRTLYLQELLRASDFLQIQRNVLRGLTALAGNIFGTKTVAAALSTGGGFPNPNDVLPSDASSGGTLVVRIPPLAMYSFAETDAASWSTIPADTDYFLIQGMNTISTDKTLGKPSGSNLRYYLIEAQITAATDESATAEVLPYYPMIQTLSTVGQSHTTTKIWVASTQGMSVSDPIVVQGIATSTGLITHIQSIGSDGGGPFITLTTALDLEPPSGESVIVRDVAPNSGNPLAGVGNNGVAQAINRTRRVSLNAKAGSDSTNPTIPLPTTLWTPLYVIGPIGSGTSNLGGGLINLHTNAPFFPGLLQREHHKGTAGQSSKIDVETELSEGVVRRAGDTMTGPLTVPSYFTVLKVDSGGTGGSVVLEGSAGNANAIIDRWGNKTRVNSSGITQLEIDHFNGNLAARGEAYALAANAGGAGFKFTGTRTDPASDNVWGLKASAAGFLDLISTNGLRFHDATGPGYAYDAIWRGGNETGWNGRSHLNDGSPGYVRFPNGFIIQWGYGNTGPTGGVGVTFPRQMGVVFETLVCITMISPIISELISGAGIVRGSQSATGFDVVTWRFVSAADHTVTSCPNIDFAWVTFGISNSGLPDV